MAGAVNRYHCNYCQEDISNLRVKCVECPDFDLCVQCFACGVEIGSHVNRHRYQIHTSGNAPIFKPPHDWSASEEITLLNHIEDFGQGNWDNLAFQLDRSVEEVESHFTNFYIHGTIGQATWPLESGTGLVKDYTIPEGGPLSPSLSLPIPPPDLSPESQRQLGYLANRDDFEREYDNEAEQLISELAFDSDDSQLEIALKLAHISIYSQKLIARGKRKQIAREYNLVHKFISSQRSKLLGGSGGGSPKPSPGNHRMSKEERAFRERMKVFCQIQSAYEHEQFIQNLKRQEELKLKIKDLCRYRRLGITTLKEIAEYECARISKRKGRKRTKKIDEAAIAAFSLSRLSSGQLPINGFKKKKRRRKRKNTYFTNKKTKYLPKP